MFTNLPFKKSQINHVPFDNFVLGILENYPQTYDWIYTNFIKIYTNKRTGAEYFFPKFMWNSCPFLDVYEIPYNMIKDNFESFAEFLRYCLKKEFYIYSLVNMKYISQYKREEDDDHNLVITNINEEKKEFQIYDFFQNGLYELYNCPFSELNQAFEKLPLCKGFDKDTYLNSYSKIVIVKYNNKKNYKFNLRIFQDNIREYMECTNLIMHSKLYAIEDNLDDEYYWGMECWDHLWEGTMLKRHFSFMVTHSQMWEQRYKYFVEKGYFKRSTYIEEEIKKINNTAKLVLSMYLKTTIIKKKNIDDVKNKMKFFISEYQKTEELICNYFLDEKNAILLKK